MKDIFTVFLLFLRGVGQAARTGRLREFVDIAMCEETSYRFARAEKRSSGKQAIVFKRIFVLMT